MLRLNGIHVDEIGKLDQESEQVRKLQRNVSELVRRIDNLHQSADTVSDVFKEDLLVLRVRLREYVIKLLHADPGKYGLKYLEILWRKAWHEPVSMARQMAGNKEKGNMLLESHLMGGLGQFHHLLLALGEKYGWPPGIRIDFMSRLEFGFTGEKKKTFSGKDSWILDVAGRCLVWLGDLSRYRIEILQGEEKARAETLSKKYYTACTKVKPSLGLAFNQLAALAGEDNHGVDTLFFYLKCAISKEKFEGGESNLKRMLEKQENSLNQLSKSSEEIATLHLMQLVSAVLEDKNEEEIILACQQSLASIHQTISAGETTDSVWLARSVAAVIFLIVKLDGNNAASARIGLCQAWLLALTSHLSGVLIAGLGKGLWGEEWTEDSISTEDSEEQAEIDQEKVQVEKRKRKRLTDLLRRRRVSHSGSSFESDLSEDELISEEANLSDEDSDSQDEDDLYFLDSDADSDSDVVVEAVEPELPDTLELVQACRRLGVFPALTLCCAWLRSQPDVVSGLGEGGVQLWTKLARLFTLLNIQSSRYTKNDKVTKLVSKNTGVPLEEHFYLRETDLFTNQLNHIEDWSKEHIGGPIGETLNRITSLENWREWLVSLEACPIRWREGEGRAVLVKSTPIEKKSVMKHMAELWLKDEVSNLEKNNAESCTFVVDAHALIADLQMVKRVAGYRKFTVIVPQVVVRELDNIKKQVRDARLSIRWLERELSRGHKGLQAQEADQKLKISTPPPPRKDPGWARHSVLQCLAYFAAKDEVIFLTGDREILQETDVEATKVLRELGVRVEQVENFMQRYLGLRDVIRQRKRSGSGKRSWKREGRERRERMLERERSADRSEDIG